MESILLQSAFPVSYYYELNKYFKLFIHLVNTIWMPPIYYKGFFCGSAGKESTCNVGDLGFIPGLERSPGEGKGYPLQYFSLENSMDMGSQTVGHDWATFALLHYLLQGILEVPLKAFAIQECSSRWIAGPCLPQVSIIFCICFHSNLALSFR